MKYDLISVGNAIVDVIASCPEDFLTEEAMNKGDMALIDKDRAVHLYGRMGDKVETSGGANANIAVGFAQCAKAAGEGTVGYVGKVANDALGDTYVADIEAQGVTYCAPRDETSNPTGRSMIFVTPDGERTMNTFVGAATELSTAHLPKEVFSNAKIVCIEGYMYAEPCTQEAILEAARMTKAAGGQVSVTMSAFFIADVFRPVLQAWIDEGLIDILFANQKEAEIFAETEDFEQALAKLAAQVPHVVVTRSELGSVTMANGQRYDVPTKPVAKVVDATGAGDNFAAGYLYGIAMGESITDASLRGAKMGAAVIQQIGPRLPA